MATFSRRAVATWDGEVVRGTGLVEAGTGAFSVSATFPRLAGEAPGHTTPEELLAASHAVCYAIGLRSVLGQRGATARRVSVTATITAEKGGGAIRVRSSHLRGVVEGLEGIEPDALRAVAHAAEEGCTISAIIRASATIEVEVVAA